MAEIIPFRPRKGPVMSQARAAAVEPLPVVADVRAPMTFRFGQEGYTNAADDALALLIEMQMHLNGLQGFNPDRHKENIQLRKQGLSEYTYEQLVEIARRSGPLQWTEKPAYYQALLDCIIKLDATEL